MEMGLQRFLAFYSNAGLHCVKTPKTRYSYQNFHYYTANLGHKSFSNFTHSVQNKASWRKYSKEFYAILKLLERSSILPPSSFSRNIFPFSGQNAHFIHTSSQYSSENKSNGKDENKDKEKKDKETFRNKFLQWFMIFNVIFGLIFLLGLRENPSDSLGFVSWTEFVHQMLAKGEVEELIVYPENALVRIRLHDNAVLKGKPVQFKNFYMNLDNPQKFEEKLRQAELKLGIQPEHGVPVTFEHNPAGAGSMLFLVLLAAAGFLIYMMFRSGKIKIDIPGSLPQLGKARFTMVDPLTREGKGVLFKDVAGLKEAKLEIMEFIDYLRRPEKYKSLGARVPKGVLLLGPPGCGKTMLAKAVANESSVPFLSMNGSEFIEMIGGLGAARVRDLFKEARKRSPCIVYIDELDAIGRKRSASTGPGGGEGEQTLNQLLVEMDGMAAREGVIMLASTNRGDVLDKALLRPGRFDRHILIDLPTLEERKEIFEQHLSPVTLEHSPSHYSFRLAQLTPGFSGADIANVANEAALHAARNKEGKVRANDLEYAVERVVGGTEKRSRVMMMEEKRVVAFHECGHALVGWMLEHTDALLKISIVPRTTNILGFAQYLPTDNKLYSTEQLFERMCMALGGRVAESLVFNRVTTGAEDDLKKVTKMAYAQVKQYGMNELVGPLSFPSDEKSSSQGIVGKKPFSRKLAATMDQQVQLLVAKAYKRTEEVLLTNMSKLVLLSESLLKNEVLNYADVEKLIGSPPHGKKNLIEAFDWVPEEDTPKNQE